jgi:DinB superfamily
MVTENAFDPRRAAHPRLARSRKRLERSRTSFLGLLDAKPTARLAARPPGGGWSVLETLEHVARVERTVIALLQSPPPATRGPALTGLVPQVICRMPVRWRLAIVARRIGKVVSPKATVPQQGMGLEAVRELARETRGELIALIIRVDPARLATLRIPHPVLGMFGGFDWVDFLAAHEERHLGQARDALRTRS